MTRWSEPSHRIKDHHLGVGHLDAAWELLDGRTGLAGRTGAPGPDSRCRVVKFRPGKAEPGAVPRSVRRKSGRKPGRPKGQPGATLEITDHTDTLRRVLTVALEQSLYGMRLGYRRLFDLG